MIKHHDQREMVQRPTAPDGTVGPLLDMLCTPEELGKNGRLFAHIKLIPGAAIPEHTHTGDFEYYYILSGQGDYTDNGVLSPVGPGDVTFCADGDRHGLQNTGNGDLELIALIGYTLHQL